MQEGPASRGQCSQHRVGKVPPKFLEVKIGDGAFVGGFMEALGVDYRRVTVSEPVSTVLSMKMRYGSTWIRNDLDMCG